MKVTQDVSYTNKKGDHVMKHRILGSDGKAVLLMAKDSFLFSTHREKSTTLITKDEKFVNLMKSIESKIQKRHLTSEVQPSIIKKDGSDDEYIMFPYVSRYSAFYEMDGTINNELITESNLEGDVIIRFNGYNLVNEKIYLNMSIYQARCSIAQTRPINFDEFENTSMVDL